MDADRFAKGFERNPSDFASLSGKEWRYARDALIDPSIRWSHFFSHVVDDYLTGEKIDNVDTKHNIGLYTGDTTRHLLANIAEVTEQASVYRPALVRHLNRMNFHTMNQDMGPSWLHLIDPEAHPPLEYIHLAAIQARLAVRALYLVERRQKLHEAVHAISADQSPESGFLDRSFVGRITEIDAAITLLEVVKQRPFDEVEHLTVLPAPSKYEAFLNRSSDFLLFDTEEWQAHGIQVKTRVHDPSEYDGEFVSFIDGVVDLGNFTVTEHPNGAVSRDPVPGLIAADYILNSEALSRYNRFTQLREFEGLFGLVYHAKTVAQTFQIHMNYKDRASRAAEKIGERLVAALKDNGPEQKTEPDELPSPSE